MFGMEMAQENIQASLGNVKKPDFPEQSFYSESLNAEHEVEQKEQGMATSNGPTEAEQKHLERVETGIEKKLDEIREHANANGVGVHETGFNAFDELENQLFSQDMYGAASKIGAVLSPGGWHGKELAKWTAKDKSEYEKHKYLDYIKGSWSPISSTHLANQMHKEKNLAARKALREKYHNIRLAEALSNFVPGVGGVVHTAGTAYGVASGLTSMKGKARRKF